MKTLYISKAKNALLPIIVLPCLFKGCYVFNDIDLFTDLEEQLKILHLLNINTNYYNRTLYIDSTKLFVPNNLEIKQNKRTRGMVYFMGALLKYKKFIVFNKPGGCDIGLRKIDMHLEFFEKLKSNVIETKNNIEINSDQYDEYENINYHFKKISVGSTINSILSSIHGKDTTVNLTNIAIDPYINDLINILKKINVDILLDTKNRNIKINRTTKDYIDNTLYYSVIQDPIIIGTYIVMCLIFDKKYIIPIDDIKILGSFLDYIMKIGVKYDEVMEKQYIFYVDNINRKQIVVETSEFPGFYTDLQPLFVCLCNHYSVNLEVIENIMDNRFTYLDELKQIGYNYIYISKNHIKLLEFNLNTNVKEINFTDLRGGFVIYIELMKNKFNLSDIHIKNYDVILRGYNMNYINDIFNLN